ncbi:hypothetical protein KXX11_002953 [Aspergillus fumigatus]|nr:hypothetical protein KXX11_002953 [Aspergillus fumigatus]KAH1928046.1 hypothetical protein KXV48_003089 [Aspergillus fumigatus]KAH2289238.1 hypothetical protein KXW82_002151 [Aspergillus fumigatus]KAH2572790.1 hypothetical protein KXV99_004341 [Aspergillus fumigatus]KAH3180667.1 hypothetical protein KXX02_004471 [Aspergillus fumigatus]
MVTAEKDPESKPSSLRSIIAGSSAGAVEIGKFTVIGIAFAKTRSQLNRRLPDAKKLPWPPFGKQWYAGCTTLIIGNSLKAGIRFVAFDTFKSLLQDENGNISGPRTVIAGFGAGFTESLLAVTPFESIKTQLFVVTSIEYPTPSSNYLGHKLLPGIDDRKSPNPRMRGFLHGSKIIFQERGLRGFFQGFVPTTARQAANSATRFSSYTMLKQLAQGYVAPGEKLGTASTFALGGIAGLITVYVTQPLDTVKTSFVCAARIFKDEGLLTFWSGAVPRLARLIMSGGIVFTMYEKTMEALDAIDPERKYI